MNDTKRERWLAKPGNREKQYAATQRWIAANRDRHNANKRAGAARVRARNKAYVDAVRARTFCAECGAQPIDWHNDEHVADGKRRIGNMVTGYSIAAIQAEIDRCTPLCRRCHAALDRRMYRAWEKRRAGS